MICLATGIPTIFYKWEKYQPSTDSWTRPSSRAFNITSPKLIFSVITEEDEGVYHCIATNHDGSVVSDNATMTVFGEYSMIELSTVYQDMLCSMHHTMSLFIVSKKMSPL